MNSSLVKPERNLSILIRSVRGESFRSIHKSYSDISYGRVVDIARSERFQIHKKLAAGNPIRDVANAYGLSEAEIILIFERIEISQESKSASFQAAEDDSAYHKNNCCNKCRFFRCTFGVGPEHEEWENGLCRRFPPQQSKSGSEWPVVQGDDWCGEYSHRLPD